MPARELLPLVQSDTSMRLELLARVDVLNHHLGKLAEGIQTARTAGAIFQTLEKLMSTFKEELDNLAGKVAEIKAVVPAVVATIGEMAGKFKANAEDPARVRALADELEASKVALAGAIAAGTAAEGEAPPATDPTPTPEPAPEPKPEGETPPAG